MKIRIFITSMLFITNQSLSQEKRSGFYESNSPKFDGCGFKVDFTSETELSIKAKLIEAYFIRPICEDQKDFFKYMMQPESLTLQESNFYSSKPISFPFDLFQKVIKDQSSRFKLNSMEKNLYFLRKVIRSNDKSRLTLFLQLGEKEYPNSEITWHNLKSIELTYLKKDNMPYQFEGIGVGNNQDVPQKKNCIEAKMKAIDFAFGYCEEMFYDCGQLTNITLHKSSSSNACRASIKLLGSRPR